MTDKVFFDTSIFIYALEEENEAARQAFENAIAEDSAVTSVITLMEYATGCYKEGSAIALRNFYAFLEDNYFRIVRIDESIADRAASIRAQYMSFASMDALQLAAAKESGCNVFLTNDKRLKKYKESGLEVRML